MTAGDSEADKRHNSIHRRRLLSVAVGALVVLAGVIGALIANAINTPASSGRNTRAALGTSVTACPVTAVANKGLPSVVTISATGAAGGSTGSGEAIRSGGYILTNNHVISAAASGGEVEVLFSGGQSEPATIVGRDPPLTWLC